MEDLGISQKFAVPLRTKPLNEVVGSYTYFGEGDVLLAKITPCFENGKLGIAKGLSNGVGFGSSEYIVFRPTPMIDAGWLYYFLSRASFRREGEARMGGAVGHRRVALDFIDASLIPVPPLPEQKRVVAILDEAFAGIDAVIANTDKAMDSTRSLFKHCVETEVFGPNFSTALPVATVAELADPRKGSIRTGPFGSQLLHSEFVDSGIAVLGIDNAVENEFRWGKRRYITPEKYTSMTRYRVHPGDVIITIMGTCGRCAVVPSDIPLAINTKHLVCISLDRRKCLPEYLHKYFLFHSGARNYLTARASGAIMAGLNMGIVRELPVLLPSLEKQALVVEKIDRLQQQTGALTDVYRTKKDALAALKQSILAKAFAGDLIASPDRLVEAAA